MQQAAPQRDSGRQARRPAFGPMTIRLVHRDPGAGEMLDLAQAADMIGMSVGRQDEIDLPGRYAKSVHVAHEVLHMPRRAGVDQDGPFPAQQITVVDPDRDAMKLIGWASHHCSLI